MIDNKREEVVSDGNESDDNGAVCDDAIDACSDVGTQENRAPDADTNAGGRGKDRK